MLIDRDRSLLLIVDVQERLADSISRVEPIVATIACLTDAANRLQVPVCATEHFAGKIGPTIGTVRRLLMEEMIEQKVHFSAYAEDTFQQRLQILQRRQIVICGMEAHVCVLQTALHLQAQGFDTFLVTDASISRRPSDRDTAFERARHEGVRLVSTEMVLFEWLQRADTADFRELLPLIKARP